MKHIIEPVSLRDLVDWQKGKLLLPNPEYQRGAVWNDKQEKLLIDSILRGYPLPLFYFHFIQYSSGTLKSESYEIIDGQQRVNAICRFVGNGFKLFDITNQKVTGLPKFLKSQPCPWGGKTFSGLPAELQESFLNNQVNVAIISSDDGNEIRELFVRLQQGLPLNAQEKRDAWPGTITEFITKTAGKKPQIVGHDFFTKLLKPTNKSRGGDRQACAQLFMTFRARWERDGIVPTNGEYVNADGFVNLNSVQIDEFYRHHLDTPQSDASFRNFLEILETATDILADKKRKPLQFHLALHILLLIDALKKDFTPGWKSLFSHALDSFILKLNSATIAARRGQAENESYWTRYGVHARTSSTSRHIIAARHSFFVREMMALMKGLQRRDPRRDFTPAERELVYLRDQKLCHACGESVDWIDVEIHHLTPHGVGGETSIENATLVHKQCHRTRFHSKVTNVSEFSENITRPSWEVDEEDEQNLSVSHAKRHSHITITKDGQSEQFNSWNAARAEVWKRAYGEEPQYQVNAVTCQAFLRKQGYDVCMPDDNHDDDLDNYDDEDS